MKIAHLIIKIQQFTECLLTSQGNILINVVGQLISENAVSLLDTRKVFYKTFIDGIEEIK